jgi:hypothetical protein
MSRAQRILIAATCEASRNLDRHASDILAAYMASGTLITAWL